MLKYLPLLPERASTIAHDVDRLFFFLTGVSVFFATLIAVLLIYFAVRFRRRPGHDRLPHTEGTWALEVTWTLIPFALTMIMFVWGAYLFYRLQTAPEDALQIYAVGKQWMWKIQHLEGHREINELHIPVGRPVKVTVTSEDVLHSFYIPAFRVKQDVLPGRYTHLWFEATKAGRYHLFCAEYCGTQHSGMIGSVIAMEPADYEAWLSGARNQSMASAGAELFQQLGCATCHEADDSGRGPTLVGLAGRRVALEGGRTIVADDGYLRESILDPLAKQVAGYEPLMPTFKGLVSEEQVLQLISYIKSLTPAPGSIGDFVEEGVSR